MAITHELARRIVTLVASVAITALVLLTTAQHARGASPQDPPAQEACPNCKDEGAVACRMCASKLCVSERGFEFCSFAAECGECGGVRWVECERCAAKPKIDVAAKRAAIAAWRATFKPVDDAVGHASNHAESTHFLLTSDLKKAEGKEASSPHGALHAYLDRLESLYSDVHAMLGCKEEDFSAKTRVMIWGREADQLAASVKYTLQRSSDQSKLMGATPVVSVFYDFGRFKGDRGLHEAIVHDTTHCLLSNVYKPLALSNAGDGWIDEGLALHFEHRYWNEFHYPCFVDGKAFEKTKPARWPDQVRKAVDEGEALSLGALAGVDVVAMSLQQRMFAWSMAEYLATQRAGEVGKLVKLLKQDKELSEALPAALSRSIFDFDLDWKAWVKAGGGASAAK